MHNITDQFETLSLTSKIVLDAIAKLLNREEVTPDQVAKVDSVLDNLFDVKVAGSDRVINLKFVLCKKACHVGIEDTEIAGRYEQCISVGVYQQWVDGDLFCHQEQYTHGDYILTRLNNTDFLTEILKQNKG
jgi:hypothetical protein